MRCSIVTGQVVAPFDYRTAAKFWGIEDDPALAVLVHSIVGGTPAYRAEFVADDVPASRADFDSWVFPAIAKLEPGTARDEALAGKTATLMDEHTALGAQRARLRELTDGYRTPACGCASYRMLYDRLAAMEPHTHMHIHLENNVLFPAALVEANYGPPLCPPRARRGAGVHAGGAAGDRAERRARGGVRAPSFLGVTETGRPAARWRQPRGRARCPPPV